MKAKKAPKKEEASDIALERFRKKPSEKNFRLLYRKHTDALLRSAMYFSKGDHSLAEELVQETWLTAIEKLAQFSGQSSFRTWITGILLNKFREWIRKQKRRDQQAIPAQKLVYQNKENLHIDLQNAIMQLPDGFRQILSLHDIEGFTHKEIAEMLQINEGTSKSQLSRARKAMRAFLSTYQTKPWNN